MKPNKLLAIKPSTNKMKKYDAFFEYPDGSTKKVSFGARGYSDYLKHKSKTRRNRYITRHRANENWNQPDSPGALSRWILWPDGDAPTLDSAIQSFRQRFSL